MIGQTNKTHRDPESPVTPLLLGAEQVGLMLGISRSTVYRLNAEGRLPRPVHLGRAARWRREELLQWVQAGCPSRERWELEQGDVCKQKIHKRNSSWSVHCKGDQL